MFMNLQVNLTLNVIMQAVEKTGRHWKVVEDDELRSWYFMAYSRDESL